MSIVFLGGVMALLLWGEGQLAVDLLKHEVGGSSGGGEAAGVDGGQLGGGEAGPDLLRGVAGGHAHFHHFIFMVSRLVSLGLGFGTGLLLRDECSLPTSHRVLLAVLEYNAATRS